MRTLACLALLAFAAPALAQDAPDEVDPPAEGDGVPRDAEEAPADDWESILDEYEDDCQGEDCADESASEDPEEPDELVLPLFGATTFGLTSTTRGAYRHDNFNSNPYDDSFVSAMERLELSMQGEELRLSTRIDSSVPLFASDCPPGRESLCRISPDVRPERVSLHWTPGDFTVELGDSHVTLGRGLMLAFRKVDILGVDDALRGANLAFDDRTLFARGVFGVSNPQNLDPVSLEIVDEPHDLIGGGEAGVRLGGGDLELAARVVHAEFEADELDRGAGSTSFGYSISAPNLLDGQLALYGEAVAMNRTLTDGARPDERRWGRGVYGSAQLSLGRFTALLEWKDYSDFQLSVRNGELNTYRIYSSAPSLDRDTERFRGNYNSRGGRFQLNYAFLPSSWALSLNGVAYGHAEEDHVDPWDGILVTHGYIGLQKQSANNDSDEIGWLGELTLGYRREAYLHDPFGDVVGQGDLDWQVIHGELDMTFAYDAHSLEMRVEHRMERRYTFDYVEYVRGGASLTYSYAWSLNGQIDISPTLLWNSEKAELPSLYPGLEAKLEFAQGSFFRLFGGRTPGGRVCSGGVCRDVPPFEGVLGELVLRL